MATATAQSAKTNVWSQIFPTVTNEKQSVRFMRRLVALGVSSIAYLRFNIPDEAFNCVDLDGLKVKILRTEPGDNSATEIVKMIRWATDAVEKRFLKEMIISVNTGSPEDVFEAYTFAFNYIGAEDVPKTPTSTSRNFNNITIDINADEDLKIAARKMIRRIILLTQDLQDLPTDAYLDVKVTYHANFTPNDFHAKGFVPMAENRIESFRKSLTSLPSLATGDVASRWHEISGSISSKAWLPEHLSFITKTEGCSQLSQYFAGSQNTESSSQERVGSQDSFWQSPEIGSDAGKGSRHANNQQFTAKMAGDSNAAWR